MSDSVDRLPLAQKDTCLGLVSRAVLRDAEFDLNPAVLLPGTVTYITLSKRPREASHFHLLTGLTNQQEGGHTAAVQIREQSDPQPARRVPR